MSRRAASRNLRLQNVVLQRFQRAAQTDLGVYLNALVRALPVHPARWGFLTIMRYTNPLTHSLVSLGAPAMDPGILACRGDGSTLQRSKLAVQRH